jgi:PrcB C-terminal
LALFTEVYDNQAASPHKVDLVTTVTTDDGREYFKAEEVRDSTELGGRNGGYGYMARVPLVNLPPGAYVLTVDARSRLGAGASARRQTEFTVLNTMLSAQAAAPAGQGSAMQTIDKGVQSSVDRARQVVARTQAEWLETWRMHDYERPAPPVDFARQMVLGVFMGSRPTAGFEVDITRVHDEGGTLVVDYRETGPASRAVAAQVITSPFHLVAVPRHDGDVKFQKVE